MIQRMWQRFRQWRCRHVFYGPDLSPRDALGYVTWPCRKCGLVWRGECGLDAPGVMVGPWGGAPQQPTGEEG